MRVLRISDTIQKIGGVRNIIPGKKWLVYDSMAAVCLANRYDTEFFPVPENVRFLEPGEIPKRVLVVRCGGWGDLLQLTPALADLREKTELWIASTAQYFSVWDRAGISNILEFPFGVEACENFDVVVPLEGVVENGSDEAKTLHIADIFAAKLGMKKPSAYKPLCEVSTAERDSVYRRFPKRGLKRIGIQLFASSMCRTYPILKTIDLLHLLAAKYQVFIFSSKNSLPPGIELPEHVIDLSSKLNTMDESVRVLSTMDCLVAPDSSLIHFAHALDVPAVGLYGPFPWKLRTAHAEKTFALTSGRRSCEPCFWHAKGEHFPPNAECAGAGKCLALDDIKPERVAAKVAETRSEIGRAHV